MTSTIRHHAAQALRTLVERLEAGDSRSNPLRDLLQRAEHLAPSEAALHGYGAGLREGLRRGGELHYRRCIR